MNGELLVLCMGGLVVLLLLVILDERGKLSEEIPSFPSLIWTIQAPSEWYYSLLAITGMKFLLKDEMCGGYEDAASLTAFERYFPSRKGRAIVRLRNRRTSSMYLRCASKNPGRVHYK